MSKTVKLSQEELQTIKEGNDKITRLIFNLGQLELQKDQIKEELNETQKTQDSFGTVLFEKYGEGNISLETGELTLKEDAEPAE